jgi:hypothetical protein
VFGHRRRCRTDTPSRPEPRGSPVASGRGRRPCACAPSRAAAARREPPAIPGACLCGDRSWASPRRRGRRAPSRSSQPSGRADVNLGSPINGHPKVPHAYEEGWDSTRRARRPRRDQPERSPPGPAHIRPRLCPRRVAARSPAARHPIRVRPGMLLVMIDATGGALERPVSLRAVVLVEGLSDRIALEARPRGADGT